MALPQDWQTAANAVIKQTGGAGWVPGGAVGDEAKMKLQVRMYQERQRTIQKQITTLQNQIKTLSKKTDKGSKATVAQLNARLKNVQAQFTAVGKQIVSVQNKYYEASGQYEKLLTGANRDAFLALETVFKQYGLESLAGKIYDYVKNGYSSDTIAILLQDTPEYKKRFAANEARAKAGLPVLSPADYLNTENAYRQAMRQSGLPEGFYDSTDDFTDWIAKDVSPTELQSRVDLATQATALSNPYYKQALAQIGIDDGHLAAYFLDPDRALPFLQKSAATAQIGAAALQQGLTFDKTYAEQLATSGVTAAEAQQGYSQVASELSSMEQLGAIYGTKWTQQESEESVFGTGASATAQKAGLVAQERGQFSAAAGGARAGLSQSKAQG